nr:hypothetical protein BaRGS_011004 [Batillaria attramentaria]
MREQVNKVCQCAYFELRRISSIRQRIFSIRWPEKIRNEELWERAGQEPAAKQILRRKLLWLLARKDKLFLACVFGCLAGRASLGVPSVKRSESFAFGEQRGL